MSMMYLIRHGQASFGTENYDRLSPRGIRQAQILGRHLAGIGFLPDAVYTGTMIRQRHTADEVRACYEKLGQVLPDPVVMAGLDEFDSTAIIMSQFPEMQKVDPSLADELLKMYTDKDSFKKVFEGAMLRWVKGDKDNGTVESWASFMQRVAGALTGIMKEQGNGKNIFVYTSGGPIAASLQHFLSITPEAAIRLNWQVVNTSYTKYMYNGERVTMAGFNCISHLEMEKDRAAMISYR